MHNQDWIDGKTCANMVIIYIATINLRLRAGVGLKIQGG